MAEAKLNWLWYWNADADLPVYELAREAIRDIDEALSIYDKISEKVVCRVALRRRSANVWIANRPPFFASKYTLWSGTRWFDLESVGIPGTVRQLRSDPGHQFGPPRNPPDMLKGKEIEEFVRAASDGETANTMLILSGHGACPSALLFSMGANGQLGPATDHLTVDELAAGIKRFCQGAKLGIIGFDACQGASLEVAVGLQRCAEFMISSQSDVPGHGWDYSDWPWAIKSIRLSNAKWQWYLARNIVESFAKKRYRQASISAVDLDSTGHLVSAIRAFSRLATQSSNSEALQTLRIARDIIAMPPNTVAYRIGGKSDQVDVGRLFYLVNSIAMENGFDDVATAAQRVLAGISKMDIPTKYASPDIALQYWCGMSIYFPPQRDPETPTPTLNDHLYRDPAQLVAFKQATNWDKVIALL